LLDRWYYGIWTFPPLRFLYFNINQDLAVFYGKNRWDYYLTEALPLLLTTALPFALCGMYRSLRPGQNTHGTNGLSSMAWMAVLFILCLSLISHKEVRFLFPILPALHVIAARPFLRFIRSLGNVKRLCLGIILALNLIIALYTTQVHQRGVIDVMHFLRSDHEARMMQSEPSTTTVGFLMPCHSTPWKSHLIHGGINAWALTCEPPLDVPLESRHLYLDEADMFYADPAKWINEEMIDGNDSAAQDDRSVRLHAWPQRVVFFQQLLPTIEGILEKRGYRQCWRGFNSHWHDDWRRKGDVLVWCRQLNSN
jgi:GPI mannosyltransferase 3